MRANCFSIERFTAGLRGLFRAILVLGAMLAAAYAMVIGAYGFLVFGPPLIQVIDGPVIVTLASIWLVGLITLINFLYLLTQIVIAADDCGGHRSHVEGGAAAGAGRPDHRRRARRHPRRSWCSRPRPRCWRRRRWG